MPPRITRKRWRRPQRLTLDGPVVARRKDLVMPTFMALEPGAVRRTNQRRVRAICVAFTVGALAEGFLLSLIGLPIVVVVVFALLALAYFLGGRTACSGWMRFAFGATGVTAPEMLNILDGVSSSAKCPNPELLMTVGDAPNALALGISKGWILLTAGSARLDRMQLEAMFGQSLAHIRDGDAAVASTSILLGHGAQFATKVLGAPRGWIALLAIPLWPATLLARFVSARVTPADREHRADVAGALMTRYPPGMVQMLRSAGNEHSASVIRASDKFWLAPRTDAMHMVLDGRARAVSEM